MPRILSGRLRGRRLKVPRNVTRPTSSRVREALFDLLLHSPDLSSQGPAWWDGGRVLDLFAGSGALGFEAVSRGAGSAFFVDVNAGACAVIRDNIRDLGLEGSCDLACGRLPAGLKRLDGAYDLLFMDPPYAAWRKAGRVIEELRALALLSAGAVVVVEVPAKEVFSGKAVRWPDWGNDGTMEPVIARRWGDTGVVIFRVMSYRAKVGFERK